MRVAPRNASLKIAIVEDHGDLRDLFVDFLTEMGHEVAGYGCADDLDDNLSDGTVDLLILDLNLPGTGSGANTPLGADLRRNAGSLPSPVWIDREGSR